MTELTWLDQGGRYRHATGRDRPYIIRREEQDDGTTAYTINRNGAYPTAEEAQVAAQAQEDHYANSAPTRLRSLKGD